MTTTPRTSRQGRRVWRSGGPAGCGCSGVLLGCSCAPANGKRQTANGKRQTANGKRPGPVRARGSTIATPLEAPRQYSDHEGSQPRSGLLWPAGHRHIVWLHRWRRALSPSLSAPPTPISPSLPPSLPSSPSPSFPPSFPLSFPLSPSLSFAPACSLSLRWTIRPIRASAPVVSAAEEDRTTTADVRCAPPDPADKRREPSHSDNLAGPRGRPPIPNSRQRTRAPEHCAADNDGQHRAAQATAAGRASHRCRGPEPRHPPPHTPPPPPPPPHTHTHTHTPPRPEHPENCSRAKPRTRDRCRAQRATSACGRLPKLPARQARENALILAAYAQSLNKKKELF